MPHQHELRSAPDTVHWGVFDAALKPVLEAESGDQVTVHAIFGGPDICPIADSTSCPSTAPSMPRSRRGCSATS